MPCTPPPPAPHDPLRNYQFHIYLDAQTAAVPVGGVQRVSGLTATVTPFEIWEGGNNLHRYAQPDKINWDPVTLEQGLALDDSLEEWAVGVQYFSKTGKLMSGKRGTVAVKRNVKIEIHDPVIWTARQGKTPAKEISARCRSYTLVNAWISKYTALPKLDATASEVAIMLVELVHEGWTMTPLPAGGHASQEPFSTPT